MLPNEIYLVAGDTWNPGKHDLYLSPKNVRIKLGQMKRYYGPTGLKDQRIYKLTGVSPTGLFWEDVTESFTN